MAGRRSKRRVESMSIKFTDTQLIILSAAAQREDRCLVAPPKLKGGAAQKFAAKLLTAGLVKEIKAKPGMPPWRLTSREQMRLAPSRPQLAKRSTPR
jgi:hypothetical protein